MLATEAGETHRAILMYVAHARVSGAIAVQVLNDTGSNVLRLSNTDTSYYPDFLSY
jgi:hypothetical protein